MPKITKTRKTLMEIIKDYKKSRLEQNDNLRPIQEVQEELIQTEEKINNFNNLIDYLVGKLYNLTNDELKYILN